MRKKYPYKAGIFLLLILTILLMLAACGRTGVKSAHAQTIYAYIVEINRQAKTITLDPVEVITAADTQRMKQLGLKESDLTEGHYLYNAKKQRKMYALDDYVYFDFGIGIEARSVAQNTATVADGLIIGGGSSSLLSGAQYDSFFKQLAEELLAEEKTLYAITIEKNTVTGIRYSGLFF